MKEKDLEWSIAFQFPDYLAYPTKDGNYQPELNKNIKTFNSEEEAKSFALSKCGKYGFATIPVKTQVTIE